MPPMTQVQVFIDSLRTRRTNTTKGLEVHLANDPAVGANHPLFNTPNHQRMKVPGALSSGPGGRLPWWAKQALVAAGLTFGEIEHVSDWPSNDRDDVREAIVKAVDDNIALEFYWDLVDGDVNVTDVQNGNPIVVTFRSARSKVHYAGANNVIVNV